MTTDQDGSFKITFITKNAYYRLVEIKTPSGFKGLNAGFDFYVDEEGIVRQAPNGSPLINEMEYIPIANEFAYPSNKITINKVDSEGNSLKGAEFTIVNQDTGKFRIKTSGSDGKLVLGPKEFEEGHYLIKETKAPDGYDRTPQTHEFWVNSYGNYSQSQPSLVNRMINLFSDSLSSINFSSISYAEETNLPSEEFERNYNKDLTYPIQEGGNGAQTIKTHAPILIEAIEPSLKQTFYLNPYGDDPTTTNSNTVFSIFGKELDKNGLPTATPSATILQGAGIKVYRLISGSLPDNPKDFDSNSSGVKEVTNFTLTYVPDNDTIQINFGGAFNESPSPTYIVVLEATAENSNTRAYIGASLLNLSGEFIFPIITYPNSGTAATSYAERGYGSINLEKYDTFARPAQNAAFKLINDDTGAEEDFILHDTVGTTKNTFYLENGIRPGNYTIVETKAPDPNWGLEFNLPDDIAERSWHLTVDDTNKNGRFEYVITSTNGRAYNSEEDPRNIIIENIPSYEPLKLTLNLYEQDGITPLLGGKFTIEKSGGSPEMITPGADNTHTIKITEPGEYIIR
ncbi:MAG: prealbumin-like fold domain-containing protein [Finegoldia sp.]|nr:prealbumin-like fold domain-containing protein [Finegoldia sp.]